MNHAMLQEWRHAHGMRCLGIPNTAHFANVTLIEDALARKSKSTNLLVNYDLYDVSMFVLIFSFEILVWIVHTCSFLCHLLLQCGPKSKQTKNQKDGNQTQRWVLMFLFRTLLHIKLNSTVEIWVHALLNVVTADYDSF